MSPIATISLLVLTSAISLLEIPFPAIGDVLALTPSLISERPWMLATAMLVHANIGHLLQNMIALLIFGSFIERLVKPGRWLLIYFASGIAGNVAGLVFYPESTSLGASGAIMGLVGALTVLRPRATIWFGAELPVAFFSVIFIISDLAGLFVPSDIGNAPHLAGFFSGAAIGWAWRSRLSVEQEVRQRVRMSMRGY